MPSSHLILCHPLLLLPPIPPSIRVFSNESTLRMRWPKYWSFSFSIIPSKEHPGLISSRMDWLDLLAVQGTLKSLLQHHSSKASILQRLAFFTITLSQLFDCISKHTKLKKKCTMLDFEFKLDPKCKHIGLVFGWFKTFLWGIKQTKLDTNCSIGLPLYTFNLM